MHDPCTSCLVLLDLITLIIFRDKSKQWRFSLCCFPCTTVTSTSSLKTDC
jgi:hypothetical protein